MAQVPWTVESLKNVRFNKTRDFAIKSQALLSRHIDQSDFKHVFDNLTLLIDSLELPIKGCKSDFCTIVTSGFVQIPISFSQDITSGIYTYLATFLMKYNPDFRGIWVSFTKVKKLDSLAHINHNAELISFRISAKALIYVPQPGTKAYGQVSLATKTRITVLAYGVFNTIINNTKQNNKVETGVTVTFTIKNIAPQNDWITLFSSKFKICNI